jgi:alkylhydroperoxidase family enzyme
MSNYQAVSYEEASPELKDIYDDVCMTLGLLEAPNWLTHFGKAPHLTKGMWQMLKPESHLSPLLVEFIMFAVACRRSAPYCLELHASNILRTTKTLKYDDLRDIVENKSHGLVPDNFHIALDVASQLAIAPCSLKSEEFARLAQAGFSEVQAMEITTIVSAAMYFNTYTFAADLPITEGIVKHKD